MKRTLLSNKIMDWLTFVRERPPTQQAAVALTVVCVAYGMLSSSDDKRNLSTEQFAETDSLDGKDILPSERPGIRDASPFEIFKETPQVSVATPITDLKDQTLNDDNPYGSITSDELHQIDPEHFSQIRSYEAQDIQQSLELDSAFQANVKELVLAELSRPQSQIGVGLQNVVSDEAVNARRIIGIVQSLENEGVLVDIDDLSFTRLDDELSAGVFGSGRRIDRVVSQEDDYGNEHLSMAMLPDETSTGDLSINAPVSTGFSYQIVSSNGSVGWFGSWKGHIIGYYQKYKDFGEQDGSKDYFAYHRRSLAKPLSGTVSTHLGPATSTYYVSSADLQSGVTNSSAWKIISRTDQDPWNTVPSGSAVCSNASIGISYAGVSASTSGKWCDTIIPRRLWGGLHTRYEAKSHWWHGWNKHKLKEITNNFMVGMSVEPGTTPYWWDYNDAYFCNDGYRSDYQKEHVTAIPNNCQETTRNQ